MCRTSLLSHQKLPTTTIMRTGGGGQQDPSRVGQGHLPRLMWPKEKMQPSAPLTTDWSTSATVPEQTSAWGGTENQAGARAQGLWPLPSATSVGLKPVCPGTCRQSAHKEIALHTRDQGQVPCAHGKHRTQEQDPGHTQEGLARHVQTHTRKAQKSGCQGQTTTRRDAHMATQSTA